MFENQFNLTSLNKTRRVANEMWDSLPSGKKRKGALIPPNLTGDRKRVWLIAFKISNNTVKPSDVAIPWAFRLASET